CSSSVRRSQDSSGECGSTSPLRTAGSHSGSPSAAGRRSWISTQDRNPLGQISIAPTPLNRGRRAPAMSPRSDQPRGCLERVVVAGELLPNALGKRLCSETRLLSFAAQLLDGDVAGRVHLGARND